MTEVLRLSLLIVEDVDYNRRALQAMLECEGHDVVAAASGRDAVAIAAVHDFDAILMDINMPEVDGIEATRRIRSLLDVRRSQVPIIGLTADAQAPACYREVGIDRVLGKPVDLAGLRNMLAAALGSAACRTARAEAAVPDKDVVAAGWLEDMQRLLPRAQFEEIIDSARLAIAEHLDEVKGLLARGDMSQLAEAAHRFAGLASMHGCGRLGRLAAALEAAARSGVVDDARCRAAPLDEAAAAAIATLALL